MSVCVNIRSKKTLQPDDIFDALMEEGERIIIASPKFPCLKFGTMQKTLRGIEVNKEEKAFEVRVCIFANRADYQLFAQTIQVIMNLTGAAAFLEDDDDSPVKEPLKQFDEDWIEQQKESAFMTVRVMIASGKGPLVMDGLFCKICLGPKMYDRFDIALHGDYVKRDMDKLQHYLCMVQWHLADFNDTSSRVSFPDDDNPENLPLTISLISMHDGKVDPFDYISEANLFVMMQMDGGCPGGCPSIIPFTELWKILPEDTFLPLDERQFERIGEYTPDMFCQMKDLCGRYQQRRLHYKPTYPGDGYDNEQNTFILMWNPAISSVKLKDHNADIPRLLTAYFNWSVWDYKKANCGDRFFLLRVGEGNTGIVMSGVFDSNPYENENWSGRGREVYYMDMLPNLILDPDAFPMITTQQLEETIPSFDWSGGHSGRLLNGNDAMTLEKLWHRYMTEHIDDADGITMNAIQMS